MEMAEGEVKKKKITTLESELYLLIAKFLTTGPCKEAAETLRKEIDEHQLLPKRVDWLGNEHSRSFKEYEKSLPQISNDHLLKICARIGPILDKEIPPPVPGLTSLLGVGRQSLLRTKEDLEKPKCQMSNLTARKHGMPLFPSYVVQSSCPPNLTQVLASRELSGTLTHRYAFSPKMYARQQIYRRLLGHLSSVYCILFDHTGKYIFTGADDLLVKIWNATDGRLLSSLRGHSAEITDMAVNHENTLLAAGSCDKTIRVWCLRTNAPVAVLNGHTAMVTSLQFCPYPKNPERLLVSTGNDGCVCFWYWNSRNNTFNPKPLKFTERNKPGAQMICSSFSPGGLFLATGSTDHHVRVYNIAGWNGPEKILESEAHIDRVDSLQFSNIDCRFISGSKDGTAYIWKYEKQKWTNIQLKMSTKLPGQSDEVEDSKAKLRVTMVGWTLDDSRVITAVSDFSIKVWNSHNGSLCSILKGHEDEVFVLEPHPIDTRVFLSSGHDGRIIIWDLVTGTIIKNHFNLIEGQGHGAVFDCKFSPDGLMFASTDSHGHLSIFGFGSGDRYKKVPEEQFFHTDYRPLIRDIHHHVLDEQTQMAPHLLPPPFLVDIDGNPYPPIVQRLVPGREHHKDSQLVPYVAVSAEGDSEILEPVRPANEARPTIDDMIERLQQEQNQNGSLADDGAGPSQRASTDSARSPQSSRHSQNGDRNEPEPFSPRTPRSQAAHSRVGLRRTGDVEGVQAVGNWQSRGNTAEAPVARKRYVVKPISRSLTLSDLQRRMIIADYELDFFNKERKRKPSPVRMEDESSQEKVDVFIEKRRGPRGGPRARRGATQVQATNAVEEESENAENANTSISSDSETEQDSSASAEESSGSGEYSDWVEDSNRTTTRPSTRLTKVVEPKPSTSSTRTSMRPRKAHKRFKDSENETEEEEEEPEPQPPKDKVPKKRQPPKPKTRSVNGKKLPERFRPSEWLTDVMPHKAPYVPQVGDEIVYFRQGHELYVQAVKRSQVYDIYMRSQPWRKMNLRDQEVAKIEDITFEHHPPCLCCLKLVLLNPAAKNVDTFYVKYHDMADVIDFIVLKQNYDKAMRYDWKPGDRFRSAIDKAWWLGTIKSQKPLNPIFPDSMFQCFLVKWDNGEKEHMSPWDFEPINDERNCHIYGVPDEEGGSIDITEEESLSMMYEPQPHEWSRFGQENDCERLTRGLTRIMELSIAEPFVTPVDLNLYPSYAYVIEYPMDLGTIRARLQNRFYRRLDAIRFDVRFISVNAQKFNETSSRIVKQAKCVVDLCIKFIDQSQCDDPMSLYHEMMEAKHSRSQDSQSELDVLCSETDSDGEGNISSKMKRKKRNEMRQNKQVRLDNQKYTSTSWREQCTSLLESIFHVDDSTPFRYAVNLADYPDYRDIVDIPMDLSSVRERLANNHYNSPTDFCKDMRLIFQNSRNYNINKKSKIYSMTLRLSAMFEEHIRSIVSDWRSAIKYEEKIRNNQFVSTRRAPLPGLGPGINLGASTSHSFTSSLPSSRGESSQSSVNSSFNIDSSSSKSRSTKMSNGTGSKKSKKSHSKSVSPPIGIRRKVTAVSEGSSISNGIGRKPKKRKLSDRSPTRRTGRQEILDRRKKQISKSMTENSESNTSQSPTSEMGFNRSSDSDWGPRSKKAREDYAVTTARIIKKHSDSTGHKRSTRRFPLSSPKKYLKKLSPHHKYPSRHLEQTSPSSTPPRRLASLRRIAKPLKYRNSEDSETEGASVSPAPTSSSSYQKSQSNYGSQNSTENSETSDADEESEKRHRRQKRAVTKKGKKGTPKVRTRNRGQRTVRYKENSDDESSNSYIDESADSENAEPVLSFSSRGRLRAVIKTGGMHNGKNNHGRRISKMSVSSGKNNAEANQNSLKSAQAEIHCKNKTISKQNEVFIQRLKIKRPYKLRFSKNLTRENDSGYTKKIAGNIVRKSLALKRKTSNDYKVKYTSPIATDTRMHRQLFGTPKGILKVPAQNHGRLRQTIVYGSSTTESGNENKSKFDSKKCVNSNGMQEFSNSQMCVNKPLTPDSSKKSATSRIADSRQLTPLILRLRKPSNQYISSESVARRRVYVSCKENSDSLHNQRLKIIRKHSDPGSDSQGSTRIETRNRGQRTIVYDEDSDTHYLAEILENPDPPIIKRKRHIRKPEHDIPSLPLSKHSSTIADMTSFTNKIETRNHGQRTTLYTEGDKYLEQYFRRLELE